ncbi:hypothetical protein [Mesorhizobium sp. Root552]|jgi:hypothetical protein|uniref:hypothetical protein n=1 Tax=Mesorhizobium sp. Root552 TaxID=1736555 RepID=UPI000A5AAB34|nr:hypothetical protein [Mesorhizobium sp. Root552]
MRAGTGIPDTPLLVQTILFVLPQGRRSANHAAFLRATGSGRGQEPPWQNEARGPERRVGRQISLEKPHYRRSQKQLNALASFSLASAQLKVP